MEACPVDAATKKGDLTIVDKGRCIGCGICVDGCPIGAAKLRLRPDRIGQLPIPDIKELHERILRGRGLR